jgi:hypothetical protein
MLEEKMKGIKIKHMSNQYIYIGWLIRWLALCLGLLIAFYALMVLVYCIPEKLISEHRIAADTQLSNEAMVQSFGMSPTFTVGKTGVLLDHYTDMLIMEYSGNPSNQNPFVAAIEDGYARYWHGYVIFTRPALALGTLADLRFWSMLLHYLLVGVLMVLVCKKLGGRKAAWLMLSLALVDFWAVPICFQFASVFGIMSAASIFLLLFYNKPWLKNNLPMFFFTVGAVTVYLDFLTAPIITVGIPLVLLLLLQKAQNNNGGVRTIAPSLLGLIKNGFAWLAGYVLLWAGKWVLATCILKRNVISESIDQILFRTGAIETSISEEQRGIQSYNGGSRIGGLLTSVRNMLSLPELLAAAFIVVIVLAAMLYLSKNARKSLVAAIPFAAMALTAPAWLLILSQHTLIHSYMVYRNLMVSAFAGLVALDIPLGRTIDEYKAGTLKLKRSKI